MFATFAAVLTALSMPFASTSLPPGATVDGHVPLYRAEFTNQRSVTMTFSGKAETAGVYTAPYLPALDWQKDVKSEMLIDGVPVTGIAREPIAPFRPIESALVNAGSKIDVRYTATIYDKVMTPLKPGEALPNVTPLTEEERTRFTSTSSVFRFQSAKYHELLERDGMLRKPGELDRDYAWRAVLFMGKTYNYGDGPKMGLGAAEDMYERPYGTCNQMTVKFVNMMRQAGIPARGVCGVVLDFIPHGRAEIWLEGIGWFPVDPAAAVSYKDHPERSWGRHEFQMIILQDDMPLTVPGPKLEGAKEPTRFTGGNVAALVLMDLAGKFAVAKYETTFKVDSFALTAMGH